MEGLIGDIPWGIGYSSEEFGLVSLDDNYIRYMGRLFGAWTIRQVGTDAVPIWW
jgi:hypothetical protein